MISMNMEKPDEIRYSKTCEEDKDYLKTPLFWFALKMA